MTSEKRAQKFPMTRHCQIWVVTRRQYGISALVSQTSFGGETSGIVAKCWLFSQAIWPLSVPIKRVEFRENVMGFFSRGQSKLSVTMKCP